VLPFDDSLCKEQDDIRTVLVKKAKTTLNIWYFLKSNELMTFFLSKS
jgi:hypothetical protein